MAIGGSLHDSGSVASEEPSLISLVRRASMSSRSMTLHDDNSSNHNGTRTRRSEKQRLSERERKRNSSKKKKQPQDNAGMQNRLQQLEDLIQRSMREMETLKDSESVKIQAHARGFLIRNRGLALVSQHWRERLYLLNIVKLQALARGFLRRRRFLVELQEASMSNSSNNHHNNTYRECADAGGGGAEVGTTGKPKGPMKFVKSALSRIGSKRSGRRKQRKGMSQSCTESSSSMNFTDGSSKNNGMDVSSSRNGMDSSSSTRDMDLSGNRDMDLSRDRSMSRSGRYRDMDRSGEMYMDRSRERSRYKDMDMSRSQTSLSENTTIASQSADEYVAELSTLPETDEFLSSPRTPKESKKPKFIKGALQKLNSMAKLGGDGDKKKENDNVSGKKQKKVKRQSSIKKLFSMKKSSNNGTRARTMGATTSGVSKDDAGAKRFDQGAPLSRDDHSESNEFMMESSGDKEEDDPALTTTRVEETISEIADDRRRRSIYPGDDDMNSSRDRSILSVDAESKSKDGQELQRNNIDTSCHSLQHLTESDDDIYGSHAGDDDIYGSSIEFSAHNVENLSAALLLREEDEDEDNREEFDILATGPQNVIINSRDVEDAPENADSTSDANTPKQSLRRISSKSFGERSGESIEYPSIDTPTSTVEAVAASGSVTDDEASVFESLPVIEIINVPKERNEPSIRSYSGANHERLSKTNRPSALDERPRSRRPIIEMQYSNKTRRRQENRQQMDQLKKRLEKVEKLIQETNAQIHEVTESEVIKIQAVVRGYLQRNCNTFRKKLRRVQRKKSTDFSTAVVKTGIQQRDNGKATKSGDLTNMAIVIEKPSRPHRQSRISRKQKRAEKAAARQAEQDALQQRLKAIEALITQTAHDLELEMATITRKDETGEVIQATAEVDEDSAAIKIQSLVRCAFPRKKYRLQRLRKRLQEIEEEKKTEIEEMKKKKKSEKEAFKKRAGKTDNMETRVKMAEFLKKEIEKEKEISIKLAAKLDSLNESNARLKKSNQSSVFAVGKIEFEVKAKTAEKMRIEKVVEKWKESLQEVEGHISVADKQAEMEQKVKANMGQCMRDIHVKLIKSGRHQKITEGIEALIKTVDVSNNEKS